MWHLEKYARNENSTKEMYLPVIFHAHTSAIIILQSNLDFIPPSQIFSEKIFVLFGIYCW